MPERSLQKVSTKLSKSRQLINRWAAQNDWRNRAVICDSSIVEDARKSAARDYKKMIEVQINLGKMLQAKAAKAIQNMDFENMSTKMLPALTKIIESGVEIERTARDLEENKCNAKDNSMQVDLNLNLSKLLDGELNDLAKILEKLHGTDTR